MGRVEEKERRTLITSADIWVTILSSWELNALQGHMYWNILILLLAAWKWVKKSGTHM